MVLLYGYSIPFRNWLDVIGATKQRVGYPFSAISTALFGGVIPYLVLLATGRLGRGQRALEFLFYVGFWTWKGVEVDAFYRLQAHLFGNGASAAVIAKKAIVDQFLYNPLWAGPTQIGFFLWKDSGFSLARLRRQLSDRSFAQRMLVVLMSSWVVWIPAVAIIYSLPTSLQIPLFNLVLCFWCLLLTSVSRGEE